MAETQNEVIENNEVDGGTPGFFVRNRQGITGLGIGLSVGAGAVVGQYFYNRAQRNALLRQMELALQSVEFEMANDGSLVPLADHKGRLVDTTGYGVQNSADLQQVIQNHMLSGKIRGKERARWLTVLTGLVRVAQQAHEQEIAAKSVSPRGPVQP